MTAEPEEQHSDLGFDDELDGVASEFKDWTPQKKANDTAVDLKASREAAEELGFTSREPKAAPQKEPEGQLNIRAKQSVIDDFKALGRSQEPKWPNGYVLERAMAALKRELGQGG